MEDPSASPLAPVAIAGFVLVTIISAMPRIMLYGATGHTGALCQPGRQRPAWRHWQSEAWCEKFIEAREAARLPDDAGGFRVCGEVAT